ncbi:hypothetical protein BDR03DRAFT_1001256 [Suillus americanus]|nr:hypothetical protein BDR03DRAFT_1001256 [Suillus americanus]
MWFAFKDFCVAWPLMGSMICIIVLILVSFYLLQVYRQRGRTARIRGPQSPSWLFGSAKTVNSAAIVTELYEHRAREYGAVYKVPHVLGPSRVVLWDSKLQDDGVWTDGENHKRQRKALNHAFNSSAICSLMSVIHDAAHKTMLMIAWDGEIGSNQGTHYAVIDAQQCSIPLHQAAVSCNTPRRLDSVGVAALSHHFGAFYVHNTDVVQIQIIAKPAPDRQPSKFKAQKYTTFDGIFVAASTFKGALLDTVTKNYIPGDLKDLTSRIWPGSHQAGK